MNLDDLPKGRRVLVTGITATVLAGSVYAMIAKPFADKGIALSARVGSAGQGLTTSSPIKLRGVTVGRVEKIELAGTRGARLTLRMDPGVRVPDTAKAAVEPESVFGPKFVNLIPGEHEGTGPYLADGQDVVRTSETGDLNGLLTETDKALASIDPEDVAVITDALGTALAGQGQRIHDLIDNTAVLVDVAHENRENARTFLADLASLARLRGVGQDVGTLLTAGNQTLETLNSGQDRVKKTLAGTAEVADTVEGGFTRYRGDLTQGVRSAERAVALLHDQLGIAGPSVRTFIDMLPIYRALGFVSVGDKKLNKRLIGINIVLPTDPCQMFLGVCPVDKDVYTGPENKKKRGGN